MSNMFAFSALTSLDLSGFNTEKVTDMHSMFEACDALTTIYAAPGADWNRSGLASTNMFSGCENLVGGNNTGYEDDYTDAEYARIDKDGQPGYFTLKYAIVGGVICKDKASTIAAIGNATANDTIEVVLSGAVSASDLGKAGTDETIINAIKNSPAYIKLVVPEGANIVLSGDECAAMFIGCLKLVSADLRGFNTANVTKMFYMFRECGYLTKLDLSGWNTSNVDDMSWMFYACETITSLDLSSFNTEKVTDMEVMFCGCGELTTIYTATGADWSAVGSSNNMFNACGKLVGGSGTTYSNSSYKDATRAKVDGGTGNEGYFTEKKFSYYVAPGGTGDGTEAGSPLGSFGEVWDKMRDRNAAYTIYVQGDFGNERLLPAFSKSPVSVTFEGNGTSRLQYIRACDPSTSFAFRNIALDSLEINALPDGQGGYRPTYVTMDSAAVAGWVSMDTVTELRMLDGSRATRIFDYGNLYVSGSAHIDNIRLNIYTPIIIAGALTSDTVATITPSVYADYSTVLRLAEGVTDTKLAWEFQKFVVTPNTQNSWFMQDDGKITNWIMYLTAENDAAHPYVLSYDDNFKVGSQKAGFPEVYAGGEEVTSDRDYYVTMRGYHRMSPAGNGGFRLRNTNAGTTFTFHITLEGDNIIERTSNTASSATSFEIVGPTSGTSNVDVIFDASATTGGKLTLNGAPDFKVSDNVTVTYSLASGCTFTGTIGSESYTDITAFFTAAKNHSGGCSMTITKKTSSIETQSVPGGLAPSSYGVGVCENTQEGNYIVIPNLMVSKTMISQFEYEKLMTYYGAAVGNDYASMVPSETGDDKKSTPAYYVSWIEAVIYCNLLSEADGLTPVYKMSNNNQITEEDSPWTKFYDVVKDGNGKYYYNQSPDNVSETSSWDLDASFSADFSADGYRLPTSAEYKYFLKNASDLISDDYNEWCENYNSDYRRVWFNATNQQPTNDEKYSNAREENMGFRIVRNAPVQP